MSEEGRLGSARPLSLAPDRANDTDVVLARPRDLGAVPPGAPVQDPLGVGILAAILRSKGHRVVILDAHALSLDDSGLAMAISMLRPTVVGLSLHSFADYAHCARISRAIAAIPDRPFCVWGGEHATFLANEMLEQHPEVDAVVLGEGDETFPEIVDACLHAESVKAIATEASGRGTRPHRALAPGTRIPGAVVRTSDGEVAHGGFRAAVTDLGAQPPPAKDVVKTALRSGKQVSLSLLTGRGCVHRCKFCTAHEFLRLGGGSVWRRLPPSAVADELERLDRAYRRNPLVHPVVQFQDVIFLGTSRQSLQWASDFVSELRARNLRIPFYCMTRADSIIKNEQLLPDLVDVGLWSVEVGIESGVDRILQAYNKRNSSNDNERAVGLLRTHGITFDASGYIMFDPNMTLEELRTNATYLARFGAATWDFFVTKLQLYPGTVLRDELVAAGRFDPGTDLGRTSGYEFLHPSVGEVAKYAYYYDLSIRSLDLLLRDAKAELAARVRRGEAEFQPLAEGVALVHDTYCDQLLALIDLAQAGTIDTGAPPLIERFLQRVGILTNLLEQLIQVARQQRLGGDSRGHPGTSGLLAV